MPVKYPPKVKLEFLTILECQNWGELCVLGQRGSWGFYSSRGLTSLPWFRSFFLIGVHISVFCRILSLQETNTGYGAQDVSLYMHTWRPSQNYARTINLVYLFQLVIVSFLFPPTDLVSLKQQTSYCCQWAPNNLMVWNVALCLPINEYIYNFILIIMDFLKLNLITQTRKICSDVNFC